MRRIFQIGIIMVMSVAITACGKQTQAETVTPTTVTETTIEETTMQETTAEPSTEESSIEESTEEEVVKLDLPTLSTGKTFDEVSAIQYDVLYNSWISKSDEEKIALGREGLIGHMGNFTDFTEEEKGEIADYILSKSPIPVQQQQQESKPSPTETKSQSQPAPQPAPVETPAPTQSAPQPTQPQVQETQPVQVEQSLDAEELRLKQELEQWEVEHGPQTHQADPNGHAGTPLEGDINIGG